MPGVTVTITEVNTNIAYTAVTNESGNYTFSNLKDGKYRVGAELSGFKRVIRDGVDVPVNATVRVDLKLEVGAIEESVTVVGESPLLQTDRADTSRIIESVHLLEVPLGFNRNFQGMMITVPGALRLQRPHSDFFNAQDSLSTNVNGQSRLANNVQIEGIDDNHRTGLLTTLIPSAEAIETVNISTSAYDAEFGRAGGAITNVTLKSGTNTLKGSVFAFGNNEKTNAPGYFTHTSPPGDYLQSGFTLGGPLRRNKLFFFGDYQHISDNAGRTTRSIIPPTAYRNGDFSASPTLIYDPLTGNADGTGRTPFPNNVIPANRISPIARAILANLPAPNIAGAAPGQPNYQVDYARVKTTDSFDTKFNWQIEPDAIRFRRASAFCDRSSTTRRSSAHSAARSRAVHPGTASRESGTDTTYSTGVNYTRTWSSTLVMEARGGMNYFHNEALSGGQGLKTAEEVGIRGANIDEWTSGMTSNRLRHQPEPEQSAGRLLRKPAVGSFRADGPVRDRVHQGGRQPHDQVRRGLPAHARLPAADAGQRRAARAVPVQSAADVDPGRRGGHRRLRERLRLVPARRALARSARPQGDRPGRPVLGVLLVPPGQVGGHAEADDRPRPAARVLHAVHRPGRTTAGCRTTIRRRTRCRSPATATSARASA